MSADSATLALVVETQEEDDVPISQADATPTTMTGFMLKQGHVRKNWKRRYFTLENGTLSYYVAKGGKLKGSITVSDGSVVRFISAEVAKRSYCFELVNAKSFLKMQAATPEERDEWACALDGQFRQDREHELVEKSIAVLQAGHGFIAGRPSASGIAAPAAASAAAGGGAAGAGGGGGGGATVVVKLTVDRRSLLFEPENRMVAMTALTGVRLEDDAASGEAKDSGSGSGSGSGDSGAGGEATTDAARCVWVVSLPY
jgi:hypothetical protein